VEWNEGSEAKEAHARVQGEVVRLIRTSGTNIGEIAKELDLTDSAVRNWAERAAIDQNRDPNGPLTMKERGELVRLRREMKTVTMERDFLRKAAAFFARNGT
jgi:transposase